MSEGLSDMVAMAKEYVANKIADEVDEERRTRHRYEVDFLIRNFKTWKRWYLKKNQPRNYFRVTKSTLPGFEEMPYFWVCKFQIWVKCALLEEFHITPEAYAHYAGQPTWRQQEGEPNFFIYQPHKSHE